MSSLDAADREVGAASSSLSLQYLTILCIDVTSKRSTQILGIDVSIGRTIDRLINLLILTLRILKLMLRPTFLLIPTK